MVHPARPKAYSYVRMSTMAQSQGDSRRRQLEASKVYANQHDLELVDGAELEDIGISAYTGANLRDGALGKFLELVRSGQISRGSYLLVESLDRVSRQHILLAQGTFLSIIGAGINLVTLSDQRVYRAEETDVTDLIVSLIILSRANEESETKSKRVAAAWKNKRGQASSQPMTAICPSWLKLADDRANYELIEDRAAIVRAIFKDASRGIGVYSIRLSTNLMDGTRRTSREY
jgi:DNA invertase Pin-like site-specific DNA recombinase